MTSIRAFKLRTKQERRGGRKREREKDLLEVGAENRLSTTSRAANGDVGSPEI